jgi:hypothetical protein
MKSAAQQWTQLAQQGRALIKELLWAGPFSATQLPEPTPDLVKLAGDWQTAQTAAAFVKTLKDKDVKATAPAIEEVGDVSAWETQADQWLQAVGGFLKSQRDAYAKVPHAEECFKLLDDHMSQLQNEKRVAAAIKQAQVLWSQGNIQGSLDAVHAAPLESIRDVKRRAPWQGRVEGITKSLKYKLASEDVVREAGTVKGDLAEVAAKLTRVKDFLRLYPAPPNPSFQPTQDTIQQLRKDLEVRLEELKLREEVKDRLAELGRAEDLAALQKRAAAVRQWIEENPQADEKLRAEFREQGRAALADWLAAVGFPSKDPPAKLSDVKINNQEAIESNGTRWIGQFVKRPNQWYVWVWNGPQDHSQDLQGEHQIGVNNILKGPETPMYVQWAHEYNGEVKRLGQGGSSGDWLRFLRRCKQMETELKTYRTQWGLKDDPDKACKDWSFLPGDKLIRGLAPGELADRDLIGLSQRLESLGKLMGNEGK